MITVTRTDKQLSYEERYKKKMEKYKEVYKIRTDFASKFKLKTNKTSSATSSSGSTDSGSAEKVGGASSSGASIEGGSELGRKIAEEAAKFVGKCVYRWGGKDPTTGGADCSGFTYYVYKKIANLASIGASTSTQDVAGTLLTTSLDGAGDVALPGDLIMFQGTYRSGVSHVGIVYSWPKVVHCAGKEGTDGVQFSDMSSDKYWRQHFRSIRRVISDNGKSTSSSSSGKAKALFSAKTMTVTTEQSKDISSQYVSDDDGMDIHLLKGGIRTSSPGASNGYFEIPLSWYDVGADYKPITINPTAQYIRIPTDINRATFFHQRILWGEKNGFRNFQKLNSERFIHIPRHDGFEGNLYCPDAAKAFETLLLKSKRKKLEILSGFRFSPSGLISPHEAGCAIDIRVYGEEDARKIADAAWAAGFRAIAIGGDIENDGGFVHVDIGPKNIWSYDSIPAYQGPGRWKIP